ncbi:DNA-binding response regulator, AraC family [Lachnospiraceae bacterium KM106-2]|nr:DNA-binding response regulator, AraC family [Lachnospiraceae bacterium KM106-2]
MYKIIVGEIEEQSISAIQKIIKEQIKDADLVKIVKTGDELIKETIQTEPELLIVAIEILGLNGLEAIRQIRKFNESVHIIVISSYDYFGFAVQAMHLNVSGYELKPLNESSFSQAIKQEILKIKEKDEDKKRFLREENILNDAYEYMGYSFINTVIFNAGCSKDLKVYQKYLHLSPMGFVMNIEYDNSSLLTSFDIDKMYPKICSAIKNVLGDGKGYVIGAKVFHRTVIYFNVDASARETIEHRNETIKIAKKINTVIKQLFLLDAFIGIGSIKPLARISSSYEEALDCSNYKQEGAIVHIKEIKIKAREYSNLIEQEQALVEAIRYGKQDAVYYFNNIIQSIRGYDSRERVRKIIEILILVRNELNKMNNSEVNRSNYLEYIPSIYEIDEEQQIKWAATQFNILIRNFRLKKLDRKSNTINVAIEYAQKHYSQELSLNDIAAYVNLSPQHFSKIFKEEMNTNYVEWMTNLRVSKAKELLNRSDKTIKEICYLVGYQDPNYFSRIFKKYVGISPTDYMKERAD